MPLTSKFNLSLAVSYLAATLNASAYWRALVDSPNSSEAALEALATDDTADAAVSLAAIKQHLYDPDVVESRPLFLVRHQTDLDVERFGPAGWESRGQLLMTFELNTPDDYLDDVEQAGIFFCNTLGRILDEAQDAVGDSPAGKLNVMRFDVRSLGKIDPDEINGEDAWGAFIVAHYLD